ncbi:MAG TPA: type III-A CRISPR-associated protein Cas10/Csm1, partial [Persephonella sp.]|nr:type III-A CRISPR-associated protein Cas10/Csm1 [Persephonella sp.]
HRIKPRGKQLPTDEQEVFLLVEGDIGGIQSFIYNIHRSSESELSIAKALRGRSFFLTMLPEVLARYILRELEYPITNALFIGGGKFQLLIGNTNRNRERLEKIEREINEWLFEAFHGELSISIATVKMKGDVLRNIEKEGKETFLDKVEQLQLELDRKKKRRFRELIWKGEFRGDQTKAEAICNSCRSLPVVNSKDKLCYWCDKSQQWGSILPKIKYIAFDLRAEKGKIELEDDMKIMDFGKLGRVYLLEERDLPKVKELPEILNIEDTELKIGKDKIVNGFKFIGHSAPKIGDGDLVKELNDLWKEKKESERYQSPEGKLEKDHILPFELLVEFAEGDKKLGFFRADVDYLGLILSDGLRYNEFGNEEIYTISRIATLSRMLDLFFTGYLNKLAEEVSLRYVKKSIENYKQKAEKLSSSEKERKEILEKIYDEKEEKLKVGSLIYTVYSGGDDLFVIAPYDLVIEFALRLRETFREFTCENPDFGISGGIYIGRHDTPIHLVAKFAEELEIKAKKQRIVKDMIAMFDKALLWSEEVECSVDRKGIMSCPPDDEKGNYTEQNGKSCYISLKTVHEEIVSKMISWLKSGNTGVSRGLYYKLLQLHKDFVNEDRIDPRIYPKIYYYVGRNVKDENVRKELIDTLLNGVRGSLDVKAVISNLDVILYLVLMKTRGGR